MIFERGKVLFFFKELLKEQEREGLYLTTLSGESYHPKCNIFTPGGWISVLYLNWAWQHCYYRHQGGSDPQREGVSPCGSKMYLQDIEVNNLPKQVSAS